jgi:hypothetical protein
MGYAACIEEMKNTHKIWSENMMRRDHLEDLGVGGKIVYEWILGKYSRTVWTGSIWLRIETSGRLL